MWSLVSKGLDILSWLLLSKTGRIVGIILAVVLVLSWASCTLIREGEERAEARHEQQRQTTQRRIDDAERRNTAGPSVLDRLQSGDF